MSDSATETYLAELETAEAEAAGLFEEAGPDGEGLNQRATAVIKTLRAALKRRAIEIDTIRAEARSEARAELVRERQTEANYRRLSVPESARALFSDVDPTDREAMQARAEELREAGISWNGQPQPAPPPPPDPNVAAVGAMQTAAASAGGGPEPLERRLQRMADNPAAFSDQGATR
jgi:hypothetical protein